MAVTHLAFVKTSGVEHTRCNIKARSSGHIQSTGKFCKHCEIKFYRFLVAVQSFCSLFEIQQKNINAAAHVKLTIIEKYAVVMIIYLNIMVTFDMLGWVTDGAFCSL